MSTDQNGDGSTSQHEGQFPRFDDGDVEIRLSEDPKDSYKLHSHILCLHSPFFKAGLSNRWNNNAAKNLDDGNIKWIYELVFEEKKEDAILTRKLEQVTSEHPVKEMWTGANPADVSSGLSMQLHGKRGMVVRTHRLLLEIFYRNSPPSSTSDLETAIRSLQSLVEVADMYGCNQLVAPYISDQLIADAFLAQVLNRCKDEPVTMIELATKFRCDWIFKEAATCFVGRSNPIFENGLLKLTEIGLADLFIEKRKDFVETLREVEHMLFRITGTSRDSKAHRLARAFFKETLAEAIERGDGSSMGCGYAKLYRRINDNAWVDASERDEFLVGCGSCARFDGCCWCVTWEAMMIMRPIMEDNTRAQSIHPKGDKPLTFMVFTDAELPWNNKQ